ncbi:hypothetical protein E4U17_005552 [Claviceps sp. LM77 group G4]|nr:hypothetical protein E4U17_005552 [Claviceps sp. LM77 group G4]
MPPLKPLLRPSCETLINLFDSVRDELAFAPLWRMPTSDDEDEGEPLECIKAYLKHANATTLQGALWVMTLPLETAPPSKKRKGMPISEMTPSKAVRLVKEKLVKKNGGALSRSGGEKAWVSSIERRWRVVYQCPSHWWLFDRSVSRVQLSKQF